MHIADSLVRAWRCRRCGRRGGSPISASGAGLPGLVLAIALPEAEVALVESVGKKCAWLERTVEALGAGERARRRARGRRSWTEGAAFDVVTARALAALPVLCEYAAPLLREGGALVAWKGAVDAREEARRAARRARSSASSATEVRARGAVSRARERRTLHVFRKIAPTPDGLSRGGREWPQNAR